MSYYNRKGYTTMRAADAKDGHVFSAVVKKGGKLDNQRKHRIEKAKRHARKQWRKYKDNLKEVKRRVPLAERSKINLAKFPEQYL